MKDKKTLIIGGVVLLVVIVLVVLLFVLPGNKNNNNNGNKENNKENNGNSVQKVDLEKELTEVGKTFYETQYYVGFEDPKTLANFKDTGVNVNITSLEVILPLKEDVKKALTDRECDLDQTKILINPEEPYGKENYKIKVELSCKK